MNLKIVKELLELIKNTDVVEIEWTPERIHIIRAAGQPDRTAARSREQEKSRAVQAEKPTVTVTSPLVGTFYRSASPETQPFVQVGDRVKKDQVLCVIEAMKLMNEIESDAAGVVKAILIENGQPVEYGEPLFIIG